MQNIYLILHNLSQSGLVLMGFYYQQNAKILGSRGNSHVASQPNTKECGRDSFWSNIFWYWIWGHELFELQLQEMY
jgi:hypothetical protein